MEELSDEQLDALEAYLFNRLNTEERGAFEAELVRNPALRAELALQRHLHRGLRVDATRRELEAQYGHLLARPQADEAPRRGLVRRLSPYWIAAAASLVLVLGLLGYLYRDALFAPPTNLALFDEYFDPALKPAPPFRLDPDVDAAPLELTAALARDSAAVQRAVGLLRENNTQAALTALRDIVERGTPGHWRDTADWLLSLTYLRLDRPDEALTRLRRIAQTSGHPYQAVAIRLRDRLEEQTTTGSTEASTAQVADQTNRRLECVDGQCVERIYENGRLLKETNSTDPACNCQ